MTAHARCCCRPQSASSLYDLDVHCIIVRWEHEPELAGCGDGIGLASTHSEAGGPCEPPLIGGKYDDGSSVALYANGDLFHANQKIATAVRKTLREPEGRGGASSGAPDDRVESASGVHDGAMGDDQNQTNIDQERSSRGNEGGKRVAGVDEDEGPHEMEARDPDGESTNGGKEEVRSDAEDGDEGSEIVSDDGEEDLKETGGKANADGRHLEQGGRDGVAAQGPLAALWGKGSLVTCIFDTAGGGILNFEIDGERLDACVENVFSLLGADEVYPCCCLFPLEPEVVTEKESGDNAEGEQEEESEDEDEYSESDDESDEDSEDDEEQSGEESAEDAQKSKREKDMQNLAKAAKLDVSIIMAMSREKREELRKNIEAALRASRKARVTIIAPVLPDAAQEDSDRAGNQAGGAETPGQNARADKENDGDGDGNEDEDGDGDGDEDEDVKKKKQAADESTQALDKIRWMWEQSSGLWEVYSSEISRELELARRSGSLEVTIRLGELTVLCKVSGGEQELVQGKLSECSSCVDCLREW